MHHLGRRVEALADDRRLMVAKYVERLSTISSAAIALGDCAISPQRLNLAALEVLLRAVVRLSSRALELDAGSMRDCRACDGRGPNRTLRPARPRWHGLPGCSFSISGQLDRYVGYSGAQFS